MKSIPAIIITLCFGILISGCNTSDQVSSTPASSSNTPLAAPATENASAETVTPAEPLATPSPGPENPALPLSRYALSAELDYDTHVVKVDEQISYINTSDSELDELLLLIEPNSYPNGFTLGALTWENGEPISNYSLSDRELLIHLPENLLPGNAIAIIITFQLNLPNQNAPYGYTDRQTNMGDWYPYVPPYIPEEGWLVREDAFLGEHLAYDMAEFEVEIQLANSFAANGGELVLAASSIPEIDGNIYRYHHTPARNFVWTVSHLYLEQETQEGEVLVKGYSFPYHPQADGPALEETAKALTIFNELFGPYPHKALTVVEADFLDGMEYDGLIFLSHAFYDYYTGDPQSNLTIIAAHEVAHQWWYGLVGNDQALEPWLDESLATFSEIYFYETAYPDLTDWWWENRIYFHNPQGWVDSTIYEAAGFYPYRDAVYLRGVMFLGELRDLMGEEAFLEFLRAYLEQFRYRQASGDGFFNLLSEHTSADLSGMIGTYFSRR
ncbi:MAG: hypothetical protein IMY85_08645 [Chloroflexi bacterium]|nr:hypothetical protein [Chloroflexota bacterium]